MIVIVRHNYYLNNDEIDKKVSNEHMPMIGHCLEKLSLGGCGFVVFFVQGVTIFPNLKGVVLSTPAIVIDRWLADVCSVLIC